LLIPVSLQSFRLAITTGLLASDGLVYSFPRSSPYLLKLRESTVFYNYKKLGNWIISMPKVVGSTGLILSRGISLKAASREVK
jgi:hypothetical protein